MVKNHETSFEFIFEPVNTKIYWASFETFVMRMSKNVQKPWNQSRINYGMGYDINIVEPVNSNIYWASLEIFVMRMSKNGQKPWN